MPGVGSGGCGIWSPHGNLGPTRAWGWDGGIWGFGAAGTSNLLDGSLELVPCVYLAALLYPLTRPPPFSPPLFFFFFFPLRISAGARNILLTRLYRKEPLASRGIRLNLLVWAGLHLQNLEVSVLTSPGFLEAWSVCGGGWTSGVRSAGDWGGDSGRGQGHVLWNAFGLKLKYQMRPFASN